MPDPEEPPVIEPIAPAGERVHFSLAELFALTLLYSVQLLGLLSIVRPEKLDQILFLAAYLLAVLGGAALSVFRERSEIYATFGRRIGGILVYELLLAFPVYLMLTMIYKISGG